MGWFGPSQEEISRRVDTMYERLLQFGSMGNVRHALRRAADFSEKKGEGRIAHVEDAQALLIHWYCSKKANEFTAEFNGEQKVNTIVETLHSRIKYKNLNGSTFYSLLGEYDLVIRDGENLADDEVIIRTRTVKEEEFAEHKDIYLHLPTFYFAHAIFDANRIFGGHMFKQKSLEQALKVFVDKYYPDITSKKLYEKLTSNDNIITETPVEDEVYFVRLHVRD